MADERDPKLSRHYRELEPLEPPAALDQKILAAARAATESHAPLVVPAGRHRWYYSLAAAAVLVFAVALTLHLDRERPDPEAIPSASVRGEIKQAPKVESAPGAEPQRPPAFAPDPQPSARRDAAPASPAPVEQAERHRAERSVASADAVRAQAEARAAREAAANAREQAVNAEKLAATAKQQTSASRLAAAPAAAAPENPDRWLERIAELRSRGRHADADRELANFRKAYPNYPLSNVMRERVEGTPTPSQ